MRFNKRGGLGFPEAIVAAMIVTLSLSAYLGLVALNAANEYEGSEMHIDHRMFDGLTLEDGKIVGDIEPSLTSEAERHGYRGVSFRCEVPGGLGFETVSFMIGDMDGNITSKRFIIDLLSKDGRVIPAIAEVAVCV
ncbi:MAG: hypothetical protein LBR42_03500 [Candidatus Methanoplasma sp.]|jgi:hypothetical protein|nr:hypothetical protein [Candidatus Methanoplasma sp.]